MFFSKTKKRITQLENSLDKINKRQQKLDRINMYSRLGQITYKSFITGGIYPDTFHVQYGTYIYKDGVEYQIDRLKLYNAEIDQIGLHETVIHIKDKYELDDELIKVNYIVDLEERTFIVTNGGMDIC